jgi:nitroreductase
MTKYNIGEYIMIQDMHKEIKKAVIRSQHTQRNWDLSREVPQEDIDTLVHAISNCPSKQNFAFYNAHFITNREIIEKIHDLSMGLGYNDENGDRIECTNPQILANLLVVFEEATPSKEYLKKLGDRDSNIVNLYKRDRDMAIGIAAGYLNVVGSMLGYQTGCCACFDFDAVKALLGLENEVVLAMGIGFKDPNRQRREHHVDGVMLPRRVKEDIKVKYFK